MEYEAGGAFVALDMDLQAPLFRIGFLGGTEYADLPDAPPKRYRNALSMVKRAVAFFQTGQVCAVAHLGDVLAAENAASGTTQSALESFHHAMGSQGAAKWHYAGGICDARNFGAEGYGAALSPARSASRFAYYAFFPAARWRVLVLDCCDPAADAAAGSSLGSAQLTWLGAQLSVASAEGERVIVLSHRGLLGESALPNASAVLERVTAYPGVVVAVLSLGDGGGAYEADSRGVHHISPMASIHCEANDDAFGWLEVYDDKLRLQMCGPSPARLPGGWPHGDLCLPGGGALVASNGDLTGVLSFLLWLSFVFARAVAAPFAPMMRMLTSEEPPAEEEAAGELADSEAGSVPAGTAPPAPLPAQPEPSAPFAGGGAAAADTAAGGGGGATSAPVGNDANADDGAV